MHTMHTIPCIPCIPRRIWQERAELTERVRKRTMDLAWAMTKRQIEATARQVVIHTPHCTLHTAHIALHTPHLTPHTLHLLSPAECPTYADAAGG